MLIYREVFSMLSTNFYHYPFSQRTDAFFGGRSPFLKRLPLTLDLSFQPGLGNENRFVDQFSNEIRRLNLRESKLARQLAKAQKEKLTEAQQQELALEQGQIEISKKYLNMILSAIQQSMQTITANFR